MPVLVEVRPGAVVMSDGTAGASDTMAGLIARGLRARLDVQSLLTGQLLIALDFFPPPPGAAAEPPPPGVIPSVPSTLANLQRTVDGALMGAPEIAASLQKLVADACGTCSRTPTAQKLGGDPGLAGGPGREAGRSARAGAARPGRSAAASRRPAQGRCARCGR